MVFSSISFLYYFLPVLIIIYFIVPFKLKNAVLLIASFIFYWYGEPVYTLIMIFSSISAYAHGLLIDRYRGKRLSKLFLVSSLILGFSALLFFKYTNFIIQNTNSLLNTKIGLLKLALPIGISFYTFQTLSYVIDVYRNDTEVQKNFFKLALYVTLFPQLIAGPIVRYTDIEKELSYRVHSFEGFSKGVTRFVIGLSKKILIANVLGELVEIFRHTDEKSVLFYWIYAVSYMLHVYFDFSGYSDMAIGLGHIFGFKFPENFNYPFISKGLTEFWRRWHMTLGSWFRDYVYIPMGGNRVNKLKWFRNIFFVWFLTGFWHGAGWNYILWGLYFALFLIAEKLFINKLLDKVPTLFKRIYVLFFLIISFVIFNAETKNLLKSDISGLFGFSKIPLYNTVSVYYLRSYIVILIISFIAATPLLKNIVMKFKGEKKFIKVINTAETLVVFALLVAITAYLVDGSFNPFLYFRF